LSAASTRWITGTPPRYSRRDFYKISLIRGDNVYHYGDKSIEASGSTLIFFNPHVPYTLESRSDNNTGFFSFRETMDSLLKLSAERYTIRSVVDEQAKTGSITFESKDPKETINGFITEYDTRQGLLTSLTYRYTEYKLVTNNAGDDITILQKRTMRVEFFEYSHKVLDEALFKATTYLHFNEKYEPAEKYKGFQLYYNPLPPVSN